ncbi:hypothetical protein TH66_14380 [Carbonactinospora thermoautotrophica]|uniref:Uncharacterized protein n=1 Tax=Carbonactinospora thermoautotrophica TaxID=1469144 RepID=A0A132MRT8_9ACTN|nr:hypothetical protein [Carbonactinospora thermoautotrophica]KWX00112.1 hypothetical protein TH66_14380 [Carbonactinospora thermoautotrophica]KWX01934.1 hypothetical protein LI90_2969 [Carbonactinospora thermoautotrophica]KWX07423.1 hypothetical protein TR74_18770 [Carbonactinospora thermoautotrophica]
MIGIGVLGERGFRRYFAGRALSRFEDALVPLALAVLDLTGSATALGLALVAGRLPMNDHGLRVVTCSP